MTKQQMKLGSAVAIATITSFAFAPMSFADTSVTVNGNGTNSVNVVKLKHIKSTSLKQKNDTYVENNIYTESNTGNNKANNNTGGDTGIESGDATTKITVKTTGGGNDATVNACGCDSDTTIEISKNGADSFNKVKLKTVNSTKVKQTNESVVLNNIQTYSNTGWNTAKNNTGDDTSIETGNTDTTVNVGTETGSNSFN